MQGIRVRKKPDVTQAFAVKLVRGMRFELTRIAPYAPQTYASTSSAISAAKAIIETGFGNCNPFSPPIYKEDKKRKPCTEFVRITFFVANFVNHLMICLPFWRMRRKKTSKMFNSQYLLEEKRDFSFVRHCDAFVASVMLR